MGFMELVQVGMIGTFKAPLLWRSLDPKAASSASDLARTKKISCMLSYRSPHHVSANLSHCAMGLELRLDGRLSEMQHGD